MKYSYKYILEAINKGILFALDDFDDNDLIGLQTLTIKNQNITKDYLTLMDYVVDLGLPSGTLWCKYNLGCDFDLLNNNPKNTTPEDWYGDYYAWGELRPKTYYDWVDPNNPELNYKFCKGGNNQLIKYCTDSNYGFIGLNDGLDLLLPKDDIAYLKMNNNFKFHIPTKELCEELLQYTKCSKLIEDYAINGKKIIGLNGWELTGENKNKLFIPATGYYTNNRCEFKGRSCLIWSSNLYINTPFAAWNLNFNRFFSGVYSNVRCIGQTIRPVINL